MLWWWMLSQCVAKWESDYCVVLSLRPAHRCSQQTLEDTWKAESKPESAKSCEAKRSVRKVGEADHYFQAAANNSTSGCCVGQYLRLVITHQQKSCDVPPETIFQICHCGNFGQAISVSRSHAGRQAVVCQLLERNHWHLPQKCIRHADDRKLP